MSTKATPERVRIQLEFSTEEMNEIKQAADLMGQTVDEWMAASARDLLLNEGLVPTSQ